MPIKQYMSPNELVENLKSKGVVITNKEKTINIVKKYSYYSIVNCYKEVFKCGKSYKKEYHLMKYIVCTFLIKILDIYF